jgi:hypothetical protein
MVPRNTFNRNRIILVVVLVAAVLSYPKANAWVHSENRIERGRAVVSGIMDSLSSTAVVTSARNSYNRADAMITGSSVAAEAEARDAAKAH